MRSAKATQSRVLRRWIPRISAAITQRLNPVWTHSLLAGLNSLVKNRPRFRLPAETDETWLNLLLSGSAESLISPQISPPPPPLVFYFLFSIFFSPLLKISLSLCTDSRRWRTLLQNVIEPLGLSLIAPSELDSYSAGVETVIRPRMAPRKDNCAKYHLSDFSFLTWKDGNQPSVGGIVRRLISIQKASPPPSLVPLSYWPVSILVLPPPSLHFFPFFPLFPTRSNCELIRLQSATN